MFQLTEAAFGPGGDKTQLFSQTMELFSRSLQSLQLKQSLSVSSHCLLVCVSFYSSVVSSTQDGGMAIE